MRVYHFLSAKHALENISKGRIKIAQFQDLNDPFELLGPDLSDKPMRRVFIEFNDDIAQRFGTLCFSRTKKNPVLWSHYADKHRGVCLGFDIPDDRLREVKYTSNRLEFKSKKDLTDGKVLEFLSTKYKGWAYEEEIRCFFSLGACRTIVVSPLFSTTTLLGPKS